MAQVPLLFTQHGLGLRLGKLTIEYALTNIGQEYLKSNVFSLKLDIYKHK
jgi:hypothetical protein